MYTDSSLAWLYSGKYNTIKQLHSKPKCNPFWTALVIQTRKKYCPSVDAGINSLPLKRNREVRGKKRKIWAFCEEKAAP